MSYLPRNSVCLVFVCTWANLAFLLFAFFRITPWLLTGVVVVRDAIRAV